MSLPSDLTKVAGNLEYDTHLYDAESGHYISQRMQRMAEIIADYDPSMRLVWIPPADRAAVDTHPYAVVKVETNGMVNLVMKLTEVEMNNEREVLHRIWFGDQRTGDVLQRIEQQEMIQKILKQKEQDEKDAEAHEMALSILKSPLHTYKLPNGHKVT